MAIANRDCHAALEPEAPGSSHAANRHSPSVLVIGGGLAGLAAAVALAQHRFRVTILEARHRLGGRAGSFTDPGSGQLIDACQHVSMGCCTNLAHFFRTVGVGHLLAPQPKLYFVTPDRRMSVFKADPWPAPFHLGRALFGAHYLAPLDKLRIAYGLAAMLWADPDADPPLRPWLESHWQNQHTIERFWSVVLTSALNETVDRVGLKYARKVFRDGFIRHRDGFTVHVPTVPLDKFYSDQTRTWLAAHGVKVREGMGVRRVAVSAPGAPLSVVHAELRDGTTLTADWYVLAVPFDRIAGLLPTELLDREPYFGNVRNLTASPITSVHLWYDAPIMKLPHAVLVDCLGQWVFARGEVTPGEFYVQVVVSAARAVGTLGRDEIQRRIVEELRRVFPAAAQAKLVRSKVVTEHAATFSVVPGVDRWRPPQASPLTNLVVAGDWTATGWPATMEGAVRSGYLAAEVILQRMGRPAKLLQPDLS